MRSGYCQVRGLDEVVARKRLRKAGTRKRKVDGVVEAASCTRGSGAFSQDLGQNSTIRS